jgi:hypothetical protein
MGFEKSNGHNMPGLTTTEGDQKNETPKEYTSYGKNNPNPNGIAEIVKVAPAICAFVNSKYGEPPESPKSSEPSKYNETDYEAKFQDLRDRHSKQPEQKSEPTEDSKC